MSTTNNLNDMEIRDIKDPWVEGINSGWNVINASTLEKNITLEADVLIIGSGAGGGTSAEILSQAGLKVIILEEGKLKSSDQFDMQERSAYRDLYQEGVSRMSKDGGISILQGRSVGGTTTINWTSSFRTPEQTLNEWRTKHGVKGKSKDEMAPFFAQMEKRLHIQKWAGVPNENNNVLARGCNVLGLSSAVIPRNVKGCWNLGYCGTGCPVNAKQSMLVSTLPSAMENGATLIHHARAEKITHNSFHATGVVATALDSDVLKPRDIKITINAKHTIVAAGGINGPGLLMRSDVPDPYQRIGKRTFLHPTSSSFAVLPETVAPYYGAPQSIYSDHFQWLETNDALGYKAMGYKLEVMPLHPGLASALLGGHGEQHHKDISELANLNAMIALLRDGFHEQSVGGEIVLRSDNSPVLDYPINDYLLEGVKRSHLTMLEIQFAGGAQKARVLHGEAKYSLNWKEAQQVVANIDYAKYKTKIASAHVMGGCAMGEDEKTAVCNSDGEFHHLDGLSVIDGSLFPTSIGANPQLSIYGLAAQLSSKLRDKMVKEA